MAKGKSSNLYQLARMAKQRMKSNNYGCITGNVVSIKPRYSSYISGGIQQKAAVNPIINTYDEMMYKRVCDILNNDMIVNPISELIDRRVFNNLDLEAKQHYIYALNMKFKELKDRYYKEHMQQINSF